jgi:hypothetical protein
VVGIINKNSSRLNLVLSDTDLVEGGLYYRVDTDIVDRVVEELHSNVLSKMPFVDLSRLKVNLQRTDNKSWVQTAGSKIDGMKPNHVSPKPLIVPLNSLRLLLVGVGGVSD